MTTKAHLKNGIEVAPKRNYTRRPGTPRSALLLAGSRILDRERFSLNVTGTDLTMGSENYVRGPSRCLGNSPERLWIDEPNVEVP
jgi:hypothetical protein